MIKITHKNKLSKQSRPKAVKEADRIAGKRLRTLRKEFRLSQKQLGDCLGITSQQISKYELGENRLSLTRMQDICTIFNTNINYFTE